MLSSMILSITTFVYGIVAFFYIFSWVFKNPATDRFATGTLIIGVAGNTAGIVLRWVESYRLGMGHAPLSNLYESLIFFSWAIAVLYLILEFRYKNRTLGAFITPLIFLAITYASVQSLKPNEKLSINLLLYSDSFTIT